jgi:hypothetical protein
MCSGLVPDVQISFSDASFRRCSMCVRLVPYVHVILPQTHIRRFCICARLECRHIFGASLHT